MLVTRDIKNLKIDFVAPPFAGHLFPPLQLARYLKLQEFGSIRFFSCPIMRKAVETDGIEFKPILADKEQECLALAVADKPINRFREHLATVRNAMDVMRQKSVELRREWTVNKPDLVIADFLSPVAGFIAEEMSIPWWTAMPCLSFLEARKGPPSMCGGLMPAKTVPGECRNLLFRTLVRLFKRAVVMMFGKQFREFGFKTLYRQDGSEGYYSPDVILGMGMRELEFEPSYPPQMVWVGPCPDSPALNTPPPIQYLPGKRHVLITLGTQIPWAKQKADKIFRQVAAQCPDWIFHFGRGKMLQTDESAATAAVQNLSFYDFVPYTPDSLRHYDVIINHSGSGIMYAAAIAGVPQLVFPQDFDQFDNAARVVWHGLGLRTGGSVNDIVKKLHRLITEETFRQKCAEIQTAAKKYTPGKTLLDLLEQRFG